jgi:hypothetical protein
MAVSSSLFGTGNRVLKEGCSLKRPHLKPEVISIPKDVKSQQRSIRILKKHRNVTLKIPNLFSK